MKRWIILITMVFSSLATAVTPSAWVHKSEDDFASGKFTDTVVDSRGRVTLARKIDILAASDKIGDSVTDIAVLGDTIYASSGTQSDIYTIKGEKFEKFASLDTGMITCLEVVGGKLYVGAGGDNAGIYTLDKTGKAEKIWSDDDVKYVWAITAGPNESMFIACGSKAKVFQRDAAGGSKVIYDAGKLADNILCMTAGAGGLLYVGTDKSGLVLELDPVNETSRVILDANEKEISSLIFDQGVIYASTADIAKASRDGTVKPRKDSMTGRKPTTSPSEDGVKPKVKVKMSKHEFEKLSKAEKIVAVKEALDSDEMPEPAPDPQTMPEAGPPAQPMPSRVPPRVSAKGNAVYRIDSDGMVEDVFRNTVTIMDMLLIDDKLVLATGNGGVIFEADIEDDFFSRIVDTDAKQVTSLAVMGGKIIFATANTGSVACVSDSYCKSGTFEAKVLDADQIVRWGTMKFEAETTSANINIETRSGNIEEPQDNTWSQWSKPQAINDGYLPVMSPAGRYFQYRLTFEASQDNQTTPSLNAIGILYQMKNLAPKVTSVEYMPSSDDKRPNLSGQLRYRIVKFKAEDPNKDKLVYKVEYRPLGGTKWIEIASDIKKPQFEFDTKTVGDGKYDLKIIASDSPSNPDSSALEGSRISETITVDNTPPVISKISAIVKGDTIILRAAISDELSRINEIAYAVNSHSDWKTVLPVDGICDNTSESISVEIKDVKSGIHVIAIRAIDIYGNEGYGYVTVTKDNE